MNPNRAEQLFELALEKPSAGPAADLKWPLQNEPVVARPPSTIYKLQKAWKRNKGACSAAAAVAVALGIEG